MHTMRIMSPTHGDEHVPWDPADEKAVAKAKKKFDEAIKQGKLAYAVTEGKANKGEQIKEFVASLKEIIIVPMVAGG